MSRMKRPWVQDAVVVIRVDCLPAGDTPFSVDDVLADEADGVEEPVSAVFLRSLSCCTPMYTISSPWLVFVRPMYRFSIAVAYET